MKRLFAHNGVAISDTLEGMQCKCALEGATRNKDGSLELEFGGSTEMFDDTQKQLKEERTHNGVKTMQPLYMGDDGAVYSEDELRLEGESPLTISEYSDNLLAKEIDTLRGVRKKFPKDNDFAKEINALTQERRRRAKIRKSEPAPRSIAARFFGAPCEATRFLRLLVIDDGDGDTALLSFIGTPMEVASVRNQATLHIDDSLPAITLNPRALTKAFGVEWNWAQIVNAAWKRAKTIPVWERKAVVKAFAGFLGAA